MPFEFSHAAWTRSNSGVEAPNITDIIRLTNRVSQWAISSIVSAADPVKLLKHFIDIAYVKTRSLFAALTFRLHLNITISKLLLVLLKLFKIHL